MPNLQELGLTPDEEIPVDPIEEQPDGGGGFEFLQPAYYTFQLPKGDGFDFGKLVYDNKEYLQVNFRGKENGKPLRVKGHGLYFTQLNNMPRTITVDKKQIKTNDLLLLLKALGHTETPKTNLEYGQALLKYAEKFFRARQNLSAKATADKHGFDARWANWVNDSNKRNGKKEDEPFTTSNGNVYQALPTTADGEYVENFDVTNPTTKQPVTIRVFGNLSGFSKA